MGLIFFLWIWCILSQTPTINSQCYTETQTSTITKSHCWEEDVINLGQMMQSLLDYIRLVREQVWIMDRGVVISQTNDRSCALLLNLK